MTTTKRRTPYDLESFAAGRAAAFAQMNNLNKEEAQRLLHWFVLDDNVKQWCSQNIEEQEALLHLIAEAFPPDEWPSCKVLLELAFGLLMLESERKQNGS